MKFLVKYRTRISQVLGVIYILFFTFSEKKLEVIMPLATGIMFSAGLFFVGLGTVGRLWCAQYIAGYKTDTLISEGPYSVCRNPLYFFSLLGGIGVGLCTESIVLAMIVFAVFAIIYPVTIFKEEKELLEKHGELYRGYMSSVPRFIPNWSLFYEPPEYLIQTKIFKRELIDSLYFVLVVGLFEVIEKLLDIGAIKKIFIIY